MTDVAASQTMGGAFWRGMPMQTGLVESLRSVPPNGATPQPVPAGIDEMDRCLASVGRELGVVPNPPAMRHVAHCDQRHAVPSCPLDTLGDSMFGDDLAESQAPIEDEQRLGVDDGLAAVAGENLAIP